MPPHVDEHTATYEERYPLETRPPIDPIQRTRNVTPHAGEDALDYEERLSAEEGEWGEEDSEG